MYPSHLPYFYFSPATPPQLFIFNSIDNVLKIPSIRSNRIQTRKFGLAGDIKGKVRLYYRRKKKEFNKTLQEFVSLDWSRTIYFVLKDSRVREWK